MLRVRFWFIFSVKLRGETVKIERIASKNNDNIKKISKLFKSSSYRKQEGLFVVEGLRLCMDAVVSDNEFSTLLVTDRFIAEHNSEYEKLIRNAGTVYIIANDIMQKLSDTVTPQGVIGVIEVCEREFSFEKNGKYLALVNLQDPSNIGAAARTAEALGLSGLIVCGGCDIYNPKVLRASMGAFFRMNVRTYDTAENMLSDLKSKGIHTFASTPRDTVEPIYKCNFNSACAVLIGNEANGLPDDIIANCDRMITIPMAGRAESLNASAAAAIICYAVMNGGRA